MLNAEVFDNLGVDLGSNALRPASGVEEIASAEEVDVECRDSFAVLFLVVFHAGEEEVLLGGALKMTPAEVDLLLNVLALANLVKVLHADLTAAALAILAIIGPSGGVDAETTVIILLLEKVIDVETADEKDATTSLTKSRDAAVCVPPVAFLVDVSVLKVAGHVLVGALAGTFALDAHDNSFRGVLVEESVYVIEQVGEVLCAGEGDGEYAVDERELIVVLVGGNTDIHETNAVVELLGNTDGLTSYRGQSLVVGGGVVSSGNRENLEGPIVVKLLHPGIETTRGVDGNKGSRGDMDDSELMRAIVELLHGNTAAIGGRQVSLVLVVVRLECESDDFLAGLGSADISLVGAEGIDADVYVVIIACITLRVKLGRGRFGGIDEVGYGGSKGGDDVGGGFLFSLEASDVNELDWVDGEVADGKVCHFERTRDN